MNKKIIVTVDGGGIRGIVPATILMFLEEIIRKRLQNESFKISKFIDFLGGTSTGSIVTSLMSITDENGEPKYSMSEIMEMYMALGPKVFKKSFWHKIKTLWGLTGPSFQSSNIEGYLKEMYGDVKMKDIKIPCLFTAYDIDKRRIHIFTNKDKSGKYGEYLIRDIVRGSTSIPAYFSPAHFSVNEDENTLVDGGVFANNPALVTLMEISKTPFGGKSPGILTPNDVIFISFGTGEANLKKFPYNKVKGWGFTKWLFPVLDVLLSSSKDSVNYQMNGIFSSYNQKDNFIRIDPPLKFSKEAPTNASEENINNLLKDSFEYINSNKESLFELAERIIENKVEG